MKAYTDAELTGIYLSKIEPTGCDNWSACFREMRAVLAAKTFKEAITILEKAGWSAPRECAQKIRGSKGNICPTCHGAGIVEKARKTS